MNFFERRSEQLVARLKRIKSSPDDPMKLKSNLMMYELELERWQALNEAWKAGKPLSFAGQAPLMKALGLHNMPPRGMADRAGLEVSNQCLALIRQAGFPEMACDRSVMPAVLPELGDFPVPALVVASNAPCDHAGNSYKALARRFNVPVFNLSLDFKVDDQGLSFATRQIEELVEYTERTVPGAKYDEGLLIELLKKDEEVFCYSREVYELLKRRPCPIDPREGFREFDLASNYPNPDKLVEWAKLRRDELYERAEKGIGGMAEEKLRTIWLTTGFNNDRAPFDYLESRGVAVLMRPDDGNAMFHGGAATYFDERQFGRKLSPLEEVARITINATWLSPGAVWNHEVTRVAKDLQCDFVINFIQSGCVQTIGLARQVEEVLEREAGIPCLRMEGRGLFTDGYNRDEVIRQFADFIDMMLERKKLVS